MTSPQPPDQSAALADRIALLQASHPWMDAPTTTTLAQAPETTASLGTIANSLQDEVSRTWDGISHYWDDPVLHKQPSAALALHNYITGTLGPSPVADTDLVHIQNQLQSKGFGKDLQVDGVWNAGWQSAMQQHANALYQSQLAGNKPGSVGVGGFLHSLIHSITLPGVADSLVGFVKSIPGDIRSLGSDLWGATSALGQGAKELVTDPASLFSSKQGHQDASAYYKHIATAENTLGNHLTPAQVQAQGPSRLVNDVGTVLLFSGAGDGIKAIRAAAGDEARNGLFTRISTAEAQRGPGVIAKSLWRYDPQTQQALATKLLGRAALGAAAGGAVGGAQAELTGGDLGQGIGTGVVLGALGGPLAGKAAAKLSERDLIPRQALQNFPVLSHTGPLVAKLADGDGLYYTARTRLATPYQYGAVRLTGQALAQAQAWSLKVHGVAGLENLTGTDQPISNDVNSAHVLDPIDHAIGQSLAFTALGHHFQPSLDDLLWLFHGPVSEGARQAGKTAAGALDFTSHQSMDALHGALGQVGIIGQTERGMDSTWQNIISKAGSEGAAVGYVANKTRQAAANFYAENLYATLRAEQQTSKAQGLVSDAVPEFGTGDYRNWLRDTANQVWHDDALMSSAVGRMLASRSNYLQTFLKAERASSGMQADAHLANELGNYLRAGDALSHRILPLQEHLLAPVEREVPTPGVAPEAMTPDNPFGTTTETRLGKPTSAVAEGSYGLARDTTLTAQGWARQQQVFQQRLDTLDTLKGNPQAYLQAHDQLMSDLSQYGFQHFGLDARKLLVFSKNPQTLLDRMDEMGKGLAADVFYAHDAPQELKDAFSAVQREGYKIVRGKDIGHMYRTNLPPLQDMGAPLTRARKVASSLGVNTERFTPLDVGTDSRLRVVQALQKRIDSGRITLPPLYSIQTVLNDLQDDELLAKNMSWAANMTAEGFRAAHSREIKALQAAEPSLTDAEALARIKNDMAMAGGLRALPRKEVLRVLTRTDDTPWLNMARADGVDEPAITPLMDPKSANEVWLALQDGFAHAPGYMVGAQHVENSIKYLPLAALDKARGWNLPGAESNLALRLSSLPTALVNKRDAYRFRLSPFFSLRRVAKTNLKMGADGVEPTLNPVSTLMDEGSYQQAHDLLDRVMGTADPRYKYLDDADRTLHQSDVFGLYNPRHFEAYYALRKAQQGASDSEIRDGINRVFTYGSHGEEGRTALERTTNVIFFPFSFERTVMRNIGGYLLDHTAQTMAISGALDLYKQFNDHYLNGDNPLAASWYQQHLPLLNEVLRLNAFEHGISPGELGGINRPVLNAFLPQSWQTSKDTNKTLGRFIPAMTDLSRIMKEGGEQAHIVTTSLNNGYNTIMGRDTSALNSRPSNRTKQAQLTDAYAYRAALLRAFSGVVDYNDTQAEDVNKYHFGIGPKVPSGLQGRVIDKTTIGEIVRQAYPAFNPLDGILIKAEKVEKAQEFIAKHAGTPLYDKYKEFYDKAQTVIGHLNKDEYPVEQAAQITAIFRQTAAEYAAADPGFYKMYRATFQSAFGPLERVQ